MENVLKIEENTKFCAGCKKLKSHSEFFTRNRSSDKLESRCKPCRRIAKQGYYKTFISDPEKAQKRKKAQKVYDSSLSRAAYWYKFKYGITLEDVMAMYKSQFGKCANTGCSRETKLFTKTKTAENACVDHDHKTGKVRALLCRPCNVILGTLEAQEKVVSGLIEYKIKHQSID